MLTTVHNPIQRRTHVGLEVLANNKVALVITDLNTGRTSIVATVYERESDSAIYLSLRRIQPGMEDVVALEPGHRCVAVYRQNC